MRKTPRLFVLFVGQLLMVWIEHLVEFHYTKIYAI